VLQRPTCEESNSNFKKINNKEEKNGKNAANPRVCTHTHTHTHTHAHLTIKKFFYIKNKEQKLTVFLTAVDVCSFCAVRTLRHASHATSLE
jgi:hypothetical protein